MTASPLQPAPQDPTPPPQPVRGRRIWVRFAWIAAIVASLVGLYAALGFWAAPRLIHDEVTSQVATLYHRKATLGEVRLNPFTLRLDAEGFSLPDADGRPMLGFRHLAVQVSGASLWRGLTFTEIAVDEPLVRLVVRPNGRLNLQDLALPPSPKPSKPAKPPRIVIDHLAVRHGRIEAVDLDRPAPFVKTLSPLGFSLRDFSTVKDGAAYRLNALTERGEQIAWSGTFGVAPLASTGQFSFTGFKAAPLFDLIREAAPFDLTAGDLDLSGGYKVALRGEQLALAVDLQHARLNHPSLRARGADADWIAAQALDVAAVHVDVPAHAVTVGRVELTAPTVKAWLEPKGGLNLARFAPKSAAAPATASAPAPAWTVAAPDLRLHAGQVAFEDRSAQTPVRVTASPIELAVTGFALPIAKPVQVEASAGLDGGGRVAAKGTVSLDKLAADLDIQATSLGLVRLQPYIDRAASLKLLSGRLSAQGHLAYAANGAITFAGGGEVDSLHTVDSVLRQDFINWRALRFEGIDAQTQPLKVKVRQVIAVQPFAKVVISPNYVMNIKTVLSPAGAVPAAAGPSAPAASATAAPRQGLPVEIGQVLVQDGRMDFSDLSIQPNFTAWIQNLDGTVKGLSGRQDARAAVDLAGQVDQYAPVKIDGQVNYFAAKSYTDIRMNFQNMELTTFSPYSGKFAGYRIDKGKLNVDLHYLIDDQKLNATHRVVIDQLQLGDKVDSANAVKLPVKLIVALLKDRNGVIDLPIEIDGSLDDPKFQVWPVIWHVVRNLMVKVATAPFAALGKLVGGGEELQYVDFSPGQPDLDAATKQKLATLAKALIERPGIKLEIPMPVNPALDRPVLAEARFQAALTEAAGRLPAKRGAATVAAQATLATPGSRRAILETLYRETFGAKPVVPKPVVPKAAPPAPGAKPNPELAANAWLEAQLRPRFAVTDAELVALGRARALAVQDALLSDGQIDPARVFIITTPPKDADVVRMTLSLR